MAPPMEFPFRVPLGSKQSEKIASLAPPRTLRQSDRYIKCRALTSQIDILYIAFASECRLKEQWDQFTGQWRTESEGYVKLDPQADA